jgi:hypothetical protein
VVNDASVGTISADTLTTDSEGRLAVSLWRPQRLGTTTEEPVTDLAGLDYGLLLSDGTTTISCAPQRYSDSIGLGAPPEVSWDSPISGTTLPLHDGAPVDPAVADSGPIGFTVDIAGCLADAAGLGYSLGAPLQATLMAGTSSATSPNTELLTSTGASSAGTSYRLVVAEH